MGILRFQKYYETAVVNNNKMDIRKNFTTFLTVKTHIASQSKKYPIINKFQFAVTHSVNVP